jgi:hypothetical protein
VAAKKKAARKKAARKPDPRPKDKQGGRPTKFTRPLADTLCEGMAGGASLRRICRDDDDMPEARTVRRWMLGQGIPPADLDWFRQNYAEARRLYEDHVFDELGDVRQDTLANKDIIARDKLWSDNVKWGLARMNRAKYGDKTDIGFGGTPDTPPVQLKAQADVAHLTDDERAELRELARKAITGRKK